MAWMQKVTGVRARRRAKLAYQTAECDDLGAALMSTPMVPARPTRAVTSGRKSGRA